MTEVGGGLRHRPDIDGLRAVAIVVVVLFHARVPGFGGGFLGVDVFFVLSGYLITSILVRELDESDGLRLGRYWGRRIRRLVPAAATMAVVVVVASQALESPLEWAGRLREGAATALYWSNEHFARARTDYFAEDVVSSPFLHTWSLAVEEQFYVFWPLLLLTAHRFGARRASPVRVATICAIGVLSFTIAVVDGDGPRSFYGTPGRMWELALGGLLAASAPWLIARATPRRRHLVGVAAVGMLVLSLRWIGAVAQPSAWRLLLPTGAAAGIVAAGLGAPWVLSRALGWPPLQALGRLSYAWYLWHWPVMVLGVQRLDDDRTVVRLVLVLGALVPAYLTHRLVENPIRFSRRLAGSVRTTTLVGGAFVGTVLLVVGVSSVRTGRVEAEPWVQLAAAARSGYVPVAPVCASSDPAVLMASCSSGDADASRVVLLIGDSHARQWSPAFDRAGRSGGFRVVESIMGGCPALGPPAAGEVPLCDRRRHDLRGILEQIDPDLVVVSHSAAYLHSLSVGDHPTSEARAAAWQSAHEAFGRWLQERGTPFGVILDNPRIDRDPPDCMARHRQAHACAFGVGPARESVLDAHRAEQRAMRTVGAMTLDPIPMLCPGGSCPVVIDEIPVYVDEGHITARFSVTLAPQIAAFVERGFADPEPPSGS